MARRAFSLIELLVVVAVVAVLAGLLMPAVSQVRDVARRLGCQSNLRQLGMTVQLYAVDNRGLLVPASRGWYWADFTGCWPWGQAWNWRGALEQSGLLERSYFSGVGAGIRIMQCPLLVRQQPEGALAADWSFARTWGFNKADYSANHVLTNLFDTSFTRQADAGTMLSKIARHDQVYLASDGSWSASGRYYSPGAVPNSTLQFPHRGQLALVYLDGHAGALPAATLATFKPQATGAPGTEGHDFWRGGL